MAELRMIAKLVINELQSVIFQSYLFWIVVVIVAVQYYKTAKNRETLSGIRSNTFIRDTVTATVYGIAGGIVATILLIITGVNLTSVGIVYLWVLALILMFINPRFLCFSYSGGIIALSSLFFGWPELEVPQLMGLIAVLHLVESLLIYFSGHSGATPMYTKKSDGRLVGGFALQKFWPLPVVAVAMLSNAEAGGYTFLPVMPEWWSLIGFEQNFSIDFVGILLPFIVGLGYGDIAISSTPAQKSKMSARNLSIYSLVLLALAVLASRHHFFEFIAAFFSPLGHEAVIHIGQRKEINSRPLYVPPGEGVRILEAVPNSPLRKAGLSTGDIIQCVNGQAVNSRTDIETILSGNPGYLEIEFVAYDYNKWHKTGLNLHRGESLGLIPVPEGDETMYTEFKRKTILSTLITNVRRVIKKFTG